MKSKKLTTIMLSFCICLSILTGCGSSASNGSDDDVVDADYEVVDDDK